MKRPVLISLAIVMVVLFGGVESINAQGRGGKGGGGSSGGGGDITTYNFEDDLVTGDLVRPDGELLHVRRRGRRNSLIRIREHFIPEMLKSVENL
ncbi:MAG: hypothetical protein N2515_10395 [Deltaproteobacteria bacterium]|nr:hypothetical protein [Sandaracinaceae bacterium]MCX7809007.1 hypothetical protein [Deltaproteobacteria bacterium]